jgi:hypothetical protein
MQPWIAQIYRTHFFERELMTTGLSVEYALVSALHNRLTRAKLDLRYVASEDDIFTIKQAYDFVRKYSACTNL